MMELYIVAIFAAFVNAGVIEKNPSYVTICGTKYEEEELHCGTHNPYQLAIDYNTNTLFFSYTARSNEIFKTAYLNLKSNEYGLVSGINGGFANAVNSKSLEVYMGGQDGLYRFDYSTKSAVKINGAIDKNIWQMFYKDGLYFTTYPEEKAFVYKNNKVEEISELKNRVILIAVKNNGDYIYANSTGVFTYDKIARKALFMGDYVVNGITADIDGKIYFSSPTAIYYINEKTNVIEQLFTSNNIYGLAFESDGNIIYAKEDSIVRIKPSTKECVDKTKDDKIIQLTVAS